MQPTAAAATLLRRHGIQPSAQRVAVASYVLFTDEHPSADVVLARVKKGFPQLSRATVYNTLNTLVKKGLVREYVLAEGKIVYDPNVSRHHHFIDEETGEIHDIPWDELDVKKVDGLRGFDVSDYQVVLRGKARKRR
ncbi:MAG TPA: Fur family transcriptional regulator [bacterium]|nr:Fur family transcriptional regulator [bacterium]